MQANLMPSFCGFCEQAVRGGMDGLQMAETISKLVMESRSPSPEEWASVAKPQAKAATPPPAPEPKPAATQSEAMHPAEQGEVLHEADVHVDLPAESEHEHG